MKQILADIVVPLPLRQLYTYELASGQENLVSVGQRVVVQMGVRKLYVGIVYALRNRDDTDKTDYKQIDSVLDSSAIVNLKQLEFWKWISDYYCCTLGDTMRIALPSGLKMESKSRLFPNEVFTESNKLSPQEKALWLIVSNHQGLTLLDLESKYPRGFATSTISGLIEKEAIYLQETIGGSIEARKVQVVEFGSKIKNKKDVDEALFALRRAPKQKILFELFVYLIDEKGDKCILRKELLDKSRCNSAILRSLEGQNYLSLQTLDYWDTVHHESRDALSLRTLSVSQGKALLSVKNIFKGKSAVLLKGVTSSGKTEVYTHLINEYIKQGKQVLYFLPEIALTTQIVIRLKQIFGDRVGVYHSRFADTDQIAVWKEVSKTQAESRLDLVVGTRSSIFLPFADLGLIIIDEEHDASYKQQDPAPRYNARDAAIILAKQYGAKVLLGTATPSFETFANAQSGKYGFVELNERYKGVKLPKISVVDLRRAYKRRQMKAHLTPELCHAMVDAMDAGKQVILFQNRRGYSLFFQCASCGWIPKCNNCDVSLTFHKGRGKLVCHYCGESKSVLRTCSSCGNEVVMRGFGTEKIEDEVRTLFPERTVGRIDLDVSSSKTTLNRIIEDFSSGNIDILVGTQMIAKGLDFKGVQVVGVLNADSIFSFPDFRAIERAYQLITQVSGRAGRRKEQGHVIIQTMQAEHPIFKHLLHDSFDTFYVEQMLERKMFSYPPYFRMIKIIMRHKDFKVVNLFADLVAEGLRASLSCVILGPEYPLISKVQLYYRKEIWLKVEKKEQLQTIKSNILEHLDKARSKKGFSTVFAYLDVDPY
ncbi:MAG: primosomal protein N' [Bacteroidales bacterium]